METRKCSKCKAEKPEDDFHRVRTKYFHPYCKLCQYEYLRQTKLCECGKEISMRNMSKHKNSISHQKKLSLDKVVL